MNNNKRLVSLSAGIVALVLGFSPAAMALAESEHSGISVGATVQTQLRTDDHEGSSLGATTSAGIKESDSEEVDSEDAHTHTGTADLHRGDSQHDVDEQGDDTDEVEVDHDAALQATTTIKDSDEVHTTGELRSFLNHLLKEDDRIADVHVSSTTVETEYSLPARFLWAIPTNISAQVSVAADGSVTITYPWYAFLFAKHDDDIKTQLTQAASSTQASTSTTLSASTQAHLLNAILSVLKGN